ncbi:hypothetical protein [Bradyrhizobium canariense]|uniref:Uncharacterized protein n=1 Tax=Bradyrhizobium canariense TaxID=255045 RepID=A0A1H1XNT2_9BRAD|nr:hypothetical protein [Bradyrhizobium canariense]SDT10875.1 hypothetical protein SAMN05444158_4415 [Bradyrhizobium canariense]
MIIRIDSAPGIQLIEQADLGKFKAVVDVAENVLAQRIRETNGSLEMEGNVAVWVSRGWLLSQSGPSLSSGWQDEFDKMIVAARRHGYVDGRDRIRAHIERS